jgi:hypothetical protein
MRLRKLSANKRHRVAFGIRFKANYFGHSEFRVETSRVGAYEHGGSSADPPTASLYGERNMMRQIRADLLQTSYF